METQSKIYPSSNPQPPDDGRDSRHHDNGRRWGGLVVVIIGGILLAQQVGVDVPSWLISWPMLLIGIGLFIGVRHSFRNPGWIVLVVIGSVFMIDRYHHSFDVWRYFWPAFIIGIGLFMILKSRSRSKESARVNVLEGSEDVLDAVTIFGGIKKNIISKQFKGGEAVTVFGGTELNLMQADTQDKIVLELVQVFAGTKLIVPPQWKIHTDEVVTIFGGLNDKRPSATQTTEDTKILILKGTCIFGGIDIKSY